MEPLDLLNILDIIRNEEAYQAKIQGLLDATREYNDAKVIAATVEKAQKYLDDAKLAEEAMKLQWEQAKADIEKYREKKTKDLAEKEARLLEKEKELEAKAEVARATLAEARELQKFLQSDEKRLRDWDDHLAKKQAEVNRQEYIYTDKFRRIKAIIEE